MASGGKGSHLKALDGVDLSVPSKNAPGPCVGDWLHGDSLAASPFESLVNTLERVAFRMIQEIMRHQCSPSGPALGTYQGEVPLQSRPPLSFALEAPEVPNSPACAVDRVEDNYPGRCQPRYSFDINMVELGHRPDKGRDEGSCSHSKDKEEAAPRDRPRHCQKILVMIKMKADSSDRPVLSVPPALPVCGVDLTEQQQAFDEIKRYLTTPPVLVPPQQDRPFYIYLSVADTSIASVVVQLYEGIEKVVFYLSRRMLDAETRYPEVEKLCLCLFFTCTKLHHILLTAEIIVICKSDVVKHMLSAPVLKGRLDYFTKWVEAIPMKKVKSEDVIKFVKEHVIHRFGIPQTITTDGGSVFVSKEFRKFCDDMGIKLIRSSPYYAQANGQAEASNQSLIKLIKRKIDENPRDWHEKLSEALWAYRMSCHGAIKTSPYQLVYGQEAVLPWEITAGSRRVTFQNDLTAEEYAALMSDTIEDATELRLWSLEKIKENKARVARAYNKKVRPKEFQVGDLVWEAVLPLGTRDKAYGKWSPNWHGPYKVVQALKGNAYMLEQLDGEKFPVAVNGQHLKKYFPSMWDDGQ
ncbi:hypothetical protein QYE76_056466 [Lolium multiflorum]|uniref:Integrase catalytic domain-containing protein n=1 Tax=Lolium multiflorum TaxID=4521 RepID=A0AAD8T1N4_LOLMU|nr:hypothetical protein QYE76_056466 [Lolium multiflorum]